MLLLLQLLRVGFALLFAQSGFAPDQIFHGHHGHGHGQHGHNHRHLRHHHHLDRIELHPASFVEATLRGTSTREARSVNLLMIMEIGLKNVYSILLYAVSYIPHQHHRRHHHHRRRRHHHQHHHYSYLALDPLEGAGT